MKKDMIEVLDEWFDSRLTEIHTVLPGKIVSYDGHAKRKATVKPLIKLRTVNNDIVTIDEINNVPVMFPSTKKFNMTYKLEKDDGVLLLFSEAGMGEFLSKATEADPDSLNRFDLTDCIAIPGLWSFQNTPTPAPENDNDFILKYNNAFIKIEENTDNITVQRTNTQKTTMTASGNKMEFGTQTLEQTNTSTTVNSTSLEVLV